MSFNYTDNQICAFTAKGNSLLVSAAAGSGKTAVLVERVLKYLTEEKGDIRRLIITTYTEPAAAEMKLKIKKRIEEALEADPSDHLQFQSMLIDSAQIGTIHSLCLRLITRFFDRLKLDPALRLMDDADQALLLQEQADQLMEELYSKKGDAGIDCLLRYYASGRSDSVLQEHLIAGAKFLEEQPAPERYIELAMAPYRSKEPNLFDRFIEDGLYQFLDKKLAKNASLLKMLFEDWEKQVFPEYAGVAKAAMAEESVNFDSLRERLKTRDYDSIAALLKGYKFVSIKWIDWFGAEDKTPLKKALASGWDKHKDLINDLKALLATDQDAQFALLEEQRICLESYFDLCKTLNDRCYAARQKAGMITYGDMERLAAELLVEDYLPQTDALIPSDVALQLREEYDEIIIDEFQDANRRQDLIFRALSKEGKNLFMVGDLKQSIYRFRGAVAEIFRQKRAESCPLAPDPKNPKLRALPDPSVLELNANFRSHPGVLKFSNALFEAIMSEKCGGVDYDEREKLRPERRYNDAEEIRAEVHWLVRAKEDEEGQEQSTIEQSARYAAKLIKRMVENGEILRMPDGEDRPAEYKDFCILVRTASGVAKVYERELQKVGIPVTCSNQSVEFLDIEEVQALLAYLKVLNNPYDDVSLVALLLGDYFRFTLDQVAKIRHRQAPLYENLRYAAEKDAFYKQTLDTIEKYRGLVSGLYVYDLIQRILQESGVAAAYAAKGASEKCANLELLAEDARRFEKEGYRGLYAFIQHLTLAKENMQGGARAQVADSVKLMTIHKSKGLQFPVCILGDCQKNFNTKDESKPLLFHAEYGIAMKEIIPEAYYQGQSIPRAILKDQIHTASIGEMERVLYVGLTRAESKVIILANEEEKTMEKWVREGVNLGRPLPLWLLTQNTGSFDHWIISLLAGAEEGAPLRARFGLAAGSYPPAFIKFIEAEAEPAIEESEIPEASAEEITEYEPPKFDKAAFHKRMNQVYPHLAEVGTPAKLSVSEIKGMRSPEEDSTELIAKPQRTAAPRFIQKVRGSDRGTALHQALQFADFKVLAKDVGAELDRLVAKKFITAEQRGLIEEQKVLKFTQSSCFKAMLAADYYSKEERFLFPKQAKELFGKGEGEILIQGVLDCYWVEGEEATILDYKTDRVADPQELIDRYGVQMELYTEALKQVKGLKVGKRIIYSFALEQEIEV